MSIIIWEVSDFVVDQQIKSHIDKTTGEVSILFDTSGNHLGKMPLLFEDNGDSIPVVNVWLIHLKANLRKKSVNTQAQALLHFFIFLKDVDMTWDVIPIPLRLRPTYAFKKHLREAFQNGDIARSTANSYMCVVINFYKFYLSRKHHFENPPFNYEVVKVKATSRYEYMSNSLIYVSSTDLRLGLPNNTSYFGLSRKLLPINNNEWKVVEKYYKELKYGFSNIEGATKKVSLSIEFQLAIELCRYAGLRSSEVISLRINSIYKPNSEQLQKKYLNNTEGLILDPRLGIKTKNDTIRIAEISSKLMLELHKYINSARYIKRRKLYEKTDDQKNSSPPLLLNQHGKPYSSRSNNARWGELRNAVRVESQQFNHKFHNLRSTYAVERLKELLNSGVKEGKALDYLQSVMGHKNRETLLGYLKLNQQDISANEIYESVVNKMLEEEK